MRLIFSKAKSLTKPQKLISVLVVWILLAAVPAVYAQTIELALVGAKENTRPHRIAQKLADAIGERMGKAFLVIPLPPKRIEAHLKQKIIHGDMSRIDDFQKTVPGLVKVQEPIQETAFYVYSRTADFKVHGWESLKPYKVVYPRGFKIIEKYLKAFHHNLIDVDQSEQCFLLLAAGRADITVANPIIAQAIMKRYPEVLRGVKPLEPPVAVLKTYTFFLQEHADLARQYNRALISLKKDGTYTKIFTQTK